MFNNYYRKTIALQNQQIKFLQDKCNEQSAIIQEKEQEAKVLIQQLQEKESSLRIAEEEIKSKENKLNKTLAKGPGYKTSRGAFEGFEFENPLLVQIEKMGCQLEESNKKYQSLVSVINELSHTIKSDSPLAVEHRDCKKENRVLATRCLDLESKLTKLKKYRSCFQSSRQLQCKNCGQFFANNSFIGHYKSCGGKAESRNQYSLTDRQARTTFPRPLSCFQEYRVGIKYNDQNWIVTKSLEDFRILNQNLLKEIPDFSNFDRFQLFEEAEPEGDEIQILRKQKYLEAYLKSLLEHENIRDSLNFKNFLGLTD